MAVDDPSVKDSVVLGADLVAALGFEPVTTEPEDEEVDSSSANGSVVDDAGLDEEDAAIAGNEREPSNLDEVVPAPDAPVVGHQDHPDAGDEDEPGHPLLEDADADASLNAQDETMSTETDDDIEMSARSSDTLDDIEVIDDLTIDPDPEVDVEAETAPTRSRFGVRGLFSRQAESVIDEPGSTRDLFSSSNGDALGGDGVGPVDVESVDVESVDVESVDLEAADLRSFDLGESDLDSANADDRNLADAAAQTADLDATDGERADVADQDLEPVELAEYEPDETVVGVHDRDTDPTTALDLTGRAATIDLDERQEAEIDLGFAPDDRAVDRVPETAVAAAATATTVTGLDVSPSKASKKLRARKSRRVVRHIDPWSVLTFSILFHLAFFSAMLLAGVLVWNAAIAAGTVESIENFIRELGDYETFEIDSSQVFRASVIIAGMLTLASSVLVVLLTVVFNLISDLVGGIRVTVIEEETVRVQSDRTKRRR